MHRPLLWMTATALLAFCALARSEDKAALTQRLLNAAHSSSIDDPTLKPWHLKMDVQLYDEKGNPSEQGTIEEWWAARKDKRVYTLPSYTSTQIKDGNSLYRTKGSAIVPYFLDAIRTIVVHPVVPLEVIYKSELKLDIQSFGKTKLDCIMLEGQGATQAIIGQVQTYCLNQQDDQLRALWLDPEIDTLSGLGTFQGRSIGIASYIAISGSKVISERIATLASFTPDDSFFVPDNELEQRTGDPVWVSGGTVAHAKIRTVAPTYPEEAKRRHISGSVRMVAIIGKDGHIQNLQVVGRADPLLSEAALAAVKQWVYKPYLIDGVAADVQAILTVHFNFGPN